MDITPITSPLANATWFVGGNYNVTWDPTFPVFNLSYCSFGRGYLDVEITKKYISNATETAVYRYWNIEIASESFNLDVKEDTWNVSTSTYKDFIYKIYLIPGNMVSGESSDRTMQNEARENNCSVPVTINVLPENTTSLNSSSSSSALPAQSSTTKIPVTSSSNAPSVSPSSESAALGKKSLRTFGFSVMAIFIALAIV